MAVGRDKFFIAGEAHGALSRQASEPSLARKKELAAMASVQDFAYRY
jgi:hypothetical protein